MSERLRFEAGDRVLVIGLGRSGMASVAVLRGRGVEVIATDEMAPERLAAPIASIEERGARFVAPPEVPALLAGLGSAVLSPGVPPSSPVVRAVAAAGVPILGEVELAYRLSAAPMIAVTGTKGKSTTTALIGHLLRACGRRVRVGGNIGDPLIAEVQGAGPDDWIVAEVSSFQLETIRAFAPRVAVLLNLAPDHLDRYHSMEEYAQAKYRIFVNQSMSDWFVGNLDDPRIEPLHWRHGDTRAQARQLWFTLHDDRARASMYVAGGMLTFVPPVGDPRPIAIAPASEVPLLGEHNLRNAMAALLAALAIGCSPNALRTALGSFAPMPHRLQPIDEIDGVRYVDDSKATNPDATLAALQSFDRPIVLIAGGRAKGAPFDRLGAEIARRVKALIAIGEAGPAIARAAQGVAACERAESIEDAVERARAHAAAGDVVVLSPGCASFDMFDSAEDRGEKFGRAVARLREPSRA